MNNLEQKQRLIRESILDRKKNKKKRKPKIIHKGRKKTIIKEVGSRLQKILPVLFLLQDIDRVSPEEVQDILGYAGSLDSKKLLNEDMINDLKRYLNRWGYSDGWVDD